MNRKLCCKPVQNARETQILFECHFDEIGHISFRSLDLTLDVKMIHDWVNRDYSKQFWQLNGSRTLVENTYHSIQQNPETHSFIGLFNGVPVCQVDIYLVAGDELSDHVLAGEQDAGMHFLMAPAIKPVAGLSLKMMRSFLSFYFSFPEAGDMFGEPDAENIKANKLLEKAGFELIRPITMSCKRANLWIYARDKFLKYSDKST